MEPGSKLGHYEIVSSIGKGGMGEVYKARDTRLGREVAIKTLPPEFVRNADGLERFEREARMLAALNHPNIATIYGLEESHGTRFIVLELVDGETLSERLSRGPVPLEEALKLASQLVLALEAAHEKGVVHRDLKPANIKVTPDGQVKVLDFGLAKALVGDGAFDSGQGATLTIGGTQQGSILGTPGYMSPEQARGEATDKRTDIWAFGCVLFEMLAGHQTFAGNTLTDALAAVIARDPDWRLVPANVHPRIRLLLERCLEKDPKDRYHDIAEARVDIEQVLADPGGIYARPEQLVVEGKASVVPWIVAAAAVLAAAVLIGVTSLGPDPEPLVSRFVASAYPSLPVELPNDLRDLPTVAISPDGTQVAYPAVVDDELTIYLREVDRLEGRRLRPQGTMLVPFYSPDGASMGFVDLEAVKRVSIDGTEPPETIYEYPEGTFPVGADWAEGDTVVIGLTRHSMGLIRVSSRGGDLEVLTEPPDGVEHLWPEVLPGGRAVLFTSGSFAASGSNLQVELLDLETREPRVLIESGSQARYLDGGIIVYNDAGTLRAVRFDPDRLEIVGEPVPVLTGVEWDNVTGAAQFAVSAGGSLVYVNRVTVDVTADRTLAIVSPDGTRQTLQMRAGPYRHPRVSPDGTEIAVETLDDNGQGTVWIYNLERNALRQLTLRGSNTRPIWTPGGERIAFASNRDGNWGIYWQRADGSDVATRLTTADEGWEHYPDSFTRDGSQLTFTNLVPPSSMQSVWIVDVAGEADPRPFAEEISGGAEFSVDGDWVAYRSNNQVFVEPFPQTGALYQVTQDLGSYPVWSPNGRSLLYRRAVPVTGSASTPLVAVDVETGGAFTFGNERTLPIDGYMTFFGYRDYDFMRDGERLVMVFPAGLDETSSEQFVHRANVALNWIDELKERLSIP